MPSNLAPKQQVGPSIHPPRRPGHAGDESENRDDRHRNGESCTEGHVASPDLHRT
jgi:hypothetical protein